MSIVASLRSGRNSGLVRAATDEPSDGWGENIESVPHPGQVEAVGLVSNTVVVELLGSQLLVTGDVDGLLVEVLVRADAPIKPGGALLATSNC